jgi:hypothetical protein
MLKDEDTEGFFRSLAQIQVRDGKVSGLIAG